MMIAAASSVAVFGVDPVAAVESLPLGEPFAAALALAAEFARTEQASAIGAVFRAEIVPLSPAAYAAYAMHLARPSTGRLEQHLALVHERALLTFPELAALCRAPEALDDIAAAAMASAFPAHNLETHATAGARAAGEAVRRYQLTLARQIAELPEHELAPAARKLLASDDLLARVAAERTRREDHARAELARVQTEQRAAAGETSRAVIERVREAERVAEDARARAVETTEHARRVRADGLIARLRAHRLGELRVGHGDGARVYVVEDLVKSAHGMSTEQIAIYEAALARHEVA